MAFCPFCMLPAPGVCVQCGFRPEHAPTVSPQELKQMIASGQQFTLLDVRDDDEWNAVRIPNAKHILFKQLQTLYVDIPQDKPVIVYCQHGIRGDQAAAFLLQKGFIAQNLDGGIDRYSVEADSSIPRYDCQVMSGRTVVKVPQKRDDGILVC